MKSIKELNTTDLFESFYAYKCKCCGFSFNFPVAIATGKASSLLCPQCMSSSIKKNDRVIENEV